MTSGLVRPWVSRAEAVSEALESEIRDRNLQAGERLGTKTELRRRFNVAVATFNEALHKLESRGIVELRPGPGGGVFVGRPPALIRLGHKMLSLHGESVSVADSLAVRNALEPYVVASAVKHCTETDGADLRVLARQMAECTTPLEYLHANWAMHRRVAEISPNAILRRIYLGLLDFAEERIDDISPLDQGPIPNDHAITIHHELAEAIATGDAEAAARAIEQHRILTEEIDPA